MRFFRRTPPVKSISRGFALAHPLVARPPGLGPLVPASRLHYSGRHGSNLAGYQEPVYL
ncbi:hypothetical protein IG631_10658 [Alternaria alternata]|nr:hypothetical protein IG631_10658 [Alternaria alternata]